MEYQEYGDGWKPLVDTFHSLVNRDVEAGHMPPISFQYAREKYGALDISYAGGDAVTDAYRIFAQTMSKNMCEECGAPASQRSKQGWYATRCEDHI